MLHLSNNSWLVESGGELPTLPDSIDVLYVDVETSSGDPQVFSSNPWKVENCRVICAAVTWDNHDKIYCVKREHLVGWLRDALRRSKRLCNQNVKYDVHVLHNDLGLDFDGELVDTLTLAKLVDSDRTYKGGYGLDALATWVLNEDISYWVNSIKPWLYNARGQLKNRDYGKIPIERLADYNANDVRVTRPIWQKLEQMLPDETRLVWDTERQLTRTLIDIERRGMRIDVEGTRLAQLRSLHRMLRTKEQLKDILGYEINPKSKDDCHDLFIVRHGLPAIYTEKKGVKSKGPSFDKNVLKSYLAMPGAPIEIIKLVMEYRHEDTMCGVFWDTWLNLHVDGILHSDYNQVVRSGRMSCKTPNNQQFDNEARSLVKPRDDGHELIVADYSQIEYRIIIHYIGTPWVIQVYCENPFADFHQMMADDIGASLQISISRKPAKIVNLAISYGMGQKKTIASLQVNDEIMVASGGDPMVAREIGTHIHAEFHRRLPELKPHTRAAEIAARNRGYVRNGYGRRCHIPLEYARTGFNRVCQSHAADLMKERTIALDAVRHKYGAHLLAMVHDEVVSEVPCENAEQYAAVKEHVLNDVAVPLKVPVRCAVGRSKDSWLAAKKDGEEREKIARQRSSAVAS